MYLASKQVRNAAEEYNVDVPLLGSYVIITQHNVTKC